MADGGRGSVKFAGPLHFHRGFAIHLASISGEQCSAEGLYVALFGYADGSKSGR